MDKKSETNLKDFFSSQKVTTFKRGEIILGPGDKLDFVGQIKSGYVRVYTKNGSGQEITQPFFKSVFDFTAIYALTEASNKFYFQAMTPVDLWVAPKKDFLEFLDRNCEMVGAVTESISKMSLELAESVGKLLSSDSLGKVAMVVTQINGEKAGFGLTHKLIASLTGLTRETVTLQMLKLERMKLVDNRNRQVIILDRKGLEKVISR